MKPGEYLLEEGDITCALVHTAELLKTYGIEVSLHELQEAFGEESGYIVCEV